MKDLVTPDESHVQPDQLYAEIEVTHNPKPYAEIEALVPKQPQGQKRYMITPLQTPGPGAVSCNSPLPVLLGQGLQHAREASLWKGPNACNIQTCANPNALACSGS